MSTALKMKKADLIAELKAKLPAAKAYDRRLLAEHRAECAKVAKARRDYLRGVLKMPDAKLGELKIGGYDDVKWPTSASCPRSLAQRYEAHIKDLSRDMRNVITIDQSKRGDALYYLLTWSPDDIDETVCG